MSSVQLANVSKSFKESVAVDDISLEIQENEFFSLLGPSGCGKTTTLRMIGGFEEPTRGSVFLKGKEVTGLPPYRRDVNTVFQSYALFPHLSVAENVAFGLKRKKVAGAEISKRVTEILELVDLGRFGERRSAQLSGGQQQRVALARALVNRPAVLLLDEPLGALDLKLRKHMQIELKRIQTEVGITFIYVTHDQEEAMTMSDRLAVMNAGHLEQIGAPQDVYDLPSTEFVAGFLGASNLLEGSIEATEGPTSKVVLKNGPSISLPADRLHSKNGHVRVGVRPEKLTIENPSTPGSATGANAIEVVVSVATYTGVATSYECMTPDGNKVVVYAQNVGGDSYNPRAGERVRLTWDPDHTFAVRPTEHPKEGEES